MFVPESCIFYVTKPHRLYSEIIIPALQNIIFRNNRKSIKSFLFQIRVFNVKIASHADEMKTFRNYTTI